MVQNALMTNKKCKACQKAFTIEAGDKVFLEKFEVSEPTLCPPCRQQRRTAHVNQIYLFKRICDGTGKPIISNYPSESKCKVFSQEYWYGDQVDNTSFGRDFDFKRPFFEQFHELSKVVPRPALFTDYLRDENCAFTNYAGKNKDCYLIFDSDENRDCLYSYHVNSSINSVDCFRVENVELCYEAVDSRNCYNCQYIYNCENCRDSALLQNCIGCKNCLLSSNLTQKQYYVFNEQVSKEKYEALAAQLQDTGTLNELKSTFEKFRLQFPQKFSHGFQNEEVTGDYLVNCRSAHHCFDCRDLWDGRYVYQAFMKLKDCMDVNEGGDGELLYDSTSIGYNAYNLRFSQHCLSQVHDLTYCNLCLNGCSDLFGCIGLKRKQYCILNKQYERSEYEVLREKIITHMKSTQEWGEFFPIELSPFPYNLTIAQSFFPLIEEEVKAKGHWWLEFQPPVKGDLSDQNSKNCKSCKRLFKLIPQELSFYEEQKIPHPENCFYCRHMGRFKQRNPRELWERQCQNCETKITSSYAPNRAEKVYCEPCYLNSLT